jgi:hypothetical protein
MPKETEATDKAAEIPSSIPEIYFDIIARVVPGAIGIGLYNFESLAPNLTTPTVSFVLVCSYFLGMLLHVVGDSIWSGIFYRWQPAIGKRISFFRFHGILSLWEWIRGLLPADRAVFTKMMAERSMFQGASLVALAAVFYPPQLICKNYHEAAWHITVPSFFVLFYGMIVVHKWVSWNKDIYDVRSASQPSGS